MKLKFNAKKLGLTLAVGVVLPVTGFAQEDASSSPYSVNGQCASQGSWTRAALAQTNEIKQVITKLKDNPACVGLKTSMEANLNAMEATLKEIEGLKNTDGRTSSLAQLPEEISALRTFSRENSPFKSNVMNMLVGKTIQMSALNSKPTDAAIKASVGNLTARTKAAATVGLQQFNNTMAAFQDAHQECLEAGPTSAVIASGLVKILNAFAMSNSGLNNQVAMSVQKLTHYFRSDKKYVDAIRRLNDAEFMSSMSCLMEITTDGFCDALDAQYLYSELTKSQNVKIKKVTDKKTGEVRQAMDGMNENFDKRMAKGPLAGYYILTRQVPVVTEWLQKVQSGITPQRPTDATFRVGISMNTQEHKYQVTRIQGNFNFGRNTLRKMTNFPSKQGQALQVLLDVGSTMVGNFQTNSQYENFFMKTTSENELYFQLIGMPVPDAVGNPGSNWAGRPVDWLKTNFRSLPAFNDPEKLMEVIEKNMQQIFDISTQQSLEFYNQNFIVDKPQVVSDSLLGMTSNVRDALVNIDQYLASVERRYIDGEEKDTSNYGLIVNTRGKIGKVLKRYRELHNFGKQLLDTSRRDPQFQTLSHTEIDNKLKEVGNELLEEVYKQFEVETALTGMLPNRLAGIVLQDYTMSLKKRNEFGNHFEDIMLASGYLALNSMINMSNSNLSNVKVDLASAINIYKENIDSLENVITPVFVRNIFNNKIRMSNENLTRIDREKLAYQWAFKMHQAQMPGENANVLQRKARATVQRIWGQLINQDEEYFGISYVDKLLNPIKDIFSTISGRNKLVVSATSIFETHKTMHAHLCTQTLAFMNFQPYWALCFDADLESPLKNKNAVRDPELTKLLDTYLGVQYRVKAYEHLPAPQAAKSGGWVKNKWNEWVPSASKAVVTGDDRARNMQARICAVRDYHRRNKIAEVTSAMRDDGDSYENPFLKDLAADLAVPAVQAPEPAQQQQQQMPQPQQHQALRPQLPQQQQQK